MGSNHNADFHAVFLSGADFDGRRILIGRTLTATVLTWSLISVGGMPLESFAGHRGIDLSEAVRQKIDNQVRSAAYTIISSKGATYYGIGSALARIIEVILHDQRSVMTVCLPTPEVAGVSDVTLSLPRLVGGKGVLQTFPLPLNEQETARVSQSARVIRRALDELEESDRSRGFASKEAGSHGQIDL